MTGLDITNLIIGIITALAAIATCVNVIFVSKQLKISKEEAQKSHEEKRREKTVEIIFQWSNSQQKEFRFAEKIVERLNEDQCRKLYTQQPFIVNEDIKNMLCEICPKSKICNDNCKECKVSDSVKEYRVEGLQLSELRWYVTAYLNSLESVMVAWQQKIVDTDTIEEQYSFLHSSAKRCNRIRKLS